MVAWEGCGARQYRAGAGKDGSRRVNTGSGLAAAARPYSGGAGTKTKGKEAERKRRTWEGLPGLGSGGTRLGGDPRWGLSFGRSINSGRRC